MEKKAEREREKNWIWSLMMIEEKVSSSDVKNGVVLLLPWLLLTRIQSERTSEKIKKKKGGTSGTTKEWRRGAHLQIQYRLLTQTSALTSERRQQQREWLLHWAEAGNHAAQIKSQNREREREKEQRMRLTEKDLLLSNCWLLPLRMPFSLPSSSSSSFS